MKREHLKQMKNCLLFMVFNGGGKRRNISVVYCHTLEVEFYNKAFF